MASAVASALAATPNASTMGEADAVYADLLSFLSSPRSDLRKAAAAATRAALSDEDTNEAARRLTALTAVAPLCKIASAASVEVGSNDALAALSILCAHDSVGDQCVLDFVENKGVGRMLELALSSPPTPPSTAASVAALSNNEEGGGKSKLAVEWEGWRKQVNFACALLANATRTEKGAAEFIGLSFPAEAVPSSMARKDAGEAKEAGESDGATRGYGKRDAKPTATLLLSRFLNPAFVDTASEAYQSAVEAWNKPKGANDGQKKSSSDEDLDAYDSDPDDEALEKEENGTPNQPLDRPKADPTTNAGEHCDPYQHVAAVIMNVAQLETGRDFLMRLVHNDDTKGSSGAGASEGAPEEGGPNEGTSKSHLQSLLPQLDSPNPHRRRGVAGTIKNCCFSSDSIWWLLNVVHVDKALLMPLAGPEELTVDEKVGLDPDYWLSGPAQAREPDALVRLYVVEALLLLLASGRRARETLRERRTYVIVKLADMVEEDEQVSERMLECVQYLRRDEEGTEEGSSDRRAYERYARGMIARDGEKNKALALPPSTTAAEGSGAEGAGGEEDYDGVD
ncbi:hypothetical protein ACHAXT_010872 [Thalassiosira profunda]